MKKLFYLFILIAGSAFAKDEVSFSQEFDRANALYRQEKYEDAALAYERIVGAGLQSGELYFNLGNAYYKLNKVAPAIYNLEKALLLKPHDAAIRNNLKFAHKMMIDEVKEIPKAGFGAIIQGFTATFSYNGWAWLSVGLSATFLLFFCGYYFSGVTLYKRIFFIGMFVLALGLALCIFSAIFEKDRYNAEKPAIVFSGIASVKGEPKTSATDAAILHEGTKVYVMETLDNWKRVSLPDGTDGWIESKDIKELK